MNPGRAGSCRCQRQDSARRAPRPPTPADVAAANGTIPRGDGAGGLVLGVAAVSGTIPRGDGAGGLVLGVAAASGMISRGDGAGGLVLDVAAVRGTIPRVHGASGLMLGVAAGCGTMQRGARLVGRTRCMLPVRPERSSAAMVSGDGDD